VFTRPQSFDYSATCWAYFFPGLRIGALVLATVHIRDGRGVYPGRCALAAWAIVFVRADVYQRRGVAVVSVLEHDQIFPARVCASKTSASSFASLPELTKKQTLNG